MRQWQIVSSTIEIRHSRPKVIEDSKDEKENYRHQNGRKAVAPVCSVDRRYHGDSKKARLAGYKPEETRF
jgi:hypothetical protein